MQSGDVRSALRHYEYAQRLAPSDGEITLAIGAARLGLQQPSAIEAFELVAERDDIQEAWLGLATAYHTLLRSDLAARSLRMLLSRHGRVRGAPAVRLHDGVARANGDVGWCALSADGKLHAVLLERGANVHRVLVSFDGVPIAVRPSRCIRDGDILRASYALPRSWRHATLIGVSLKGRHLLGSPLEAGTIGRFEGFVSPLDGGLTGWGWHPHDPETSPELVVRDQSGRILHVSAVDPALGVPHEKPFARPRQIALSAADLTTLIPPIAVVDAIGRNLYGSPLDPLADRRSAAAAAELTRRLFPASKTPASEAVDLPLLTVPADIVGTRPPARRLVRAPGVDVVIPVYRGVDQTLACIASVLVTLPTGARCIVVEDASPETRLIEALSELDQQGRIILLRQPSNLGFPATANAGIRASGDRDVILLNSDTLVPRGWIERLSDAAYRGPDIGSATPFSNDATIFSYPNEDAPNPLPDQTSTNQLDRLARQANGSSTVDVPTAHGFCVYLRRDCIASVGLLRDDLFAQGYGEENDFCIRARHLGWRHVAASGIFVGHLGAGSFGGAKEQLMTRNLAILNRLHPGYNSLIDAFRQADPLAKARFAIDALRWRGRRVRKGAVILVTHSRAGGVKRRVAERCQAIAASGLRPIVLTPGKDPRNQPCCVLSDGSDEEFPNLRFDIRESIAELAAFLRHDKPGYVELHHFIGHDPRLLELASALEVSYDVVVHDYAWVCPRINLVGPDRRYCGEPAGDACEACYSDAGGNIEEDIGPSRLRERSSGVFASARRVIVPSTDVAQRLVSYFPAISCEVTPWENDAALPRRTSRPIDRLRRRVVIAGALGIEKGYEYLLACARHAVSQRLPLEFVVVGFTCDDKRLLDTGAIYITGNYHESEAAELIRAQQADVGFLPALWPETWSFTLSQMWQCGLDVIAFDLGAPADRIRQTGRGGLLPFGAPPAAACRALLAYRTGSETTDVGPAIRQRSAAVA